MCSLLLIQIMSTKIFVQILRILIIRTQFKTKQTEKIPTYFKGSPRSKTENKNTFQNSVLWHQNVGKVHVFSSLGVVYQHFKNESLDNNFDSLHTA